MSLNELSQKGEDMKQAVMRVRKLSASELLRIEEEAKEKARRDREDEILGGILKGQKQGLEQGREQGLKQGREEGKVAEREEVAVKLIKEGLENSIISRVTGWTEQEVINFKKKM